MLLEINCFLIIFSFLSLLYIADKIVSLDLFYDPIPSIFYSILYSLFCLKTQAQDERQYFTKTVFLGS